MTATSVRPPEDEHELMTRAEALAGVTLAEVASSLGERVPAHPRNAKGWTGQLLEAGLGATAGSLSEPDFQRIGVELKTLPVSPAGRPLESTYVCTVPLEQAEPPTWERSSVYRKLSRVLWFPVLVEPEQSMGARRLGWPLLWSPTDEEEALLRADWEELMDLVCLGRVEEITARHGACLQIRPKAADSHARRWGTGASGSRIRTQPRGFYLRASFTGALIARHYAGGGVRPRQRLTPSAVRGLLVHWPLARRGSLTNRPPGAVDPSIARACRDDGGAPACSTDHRSHAAPS